MNDLPRIDDQESLRAWLETRSAADSVIIAGRNALRILPIWLGRFDRSLPKTGEYSYDSALRILLALAARHLSQHSDGDRATATALAHLEVDLAQARAAIEEEGPHIIELDALAACRTAGRAAVDDEPAVFAATNGELCDLAIRGFSPAYSGNSINRDKARQLLWQAIQADSAELAADKDPYEAPLWRAQNPLVATWEIMQQVLRPKISGDFWIDWYQRALDGRRQNWPLLRDVALIDNKLWEQGGPALDREINRLLVQHSYQARQGKGGPQVSDDARQTVNRDDGADPSQAVPNDATEEIAAALASVPRPEPETLEVIKNAIAHNRAQLPATFDALEGFILLELDRLRQKNFVDEELRRQIRFMLTIYEVLQRMRAVIPARADITDVEATKVEALWTIYKRGFAKWPRDKSDEIVDGTCTAGLVLGATALGMLLGMPPIAGIAIGSFAFAKSRAGDIVKAAKDVLSPPGP